MTPYYEQRVELSDYPHQIVNADKNRLWEEEKRLQFLERKNDLAVTLQRLFRGRGLQNIMFDGKEKKLSLIEELLIISNIKNVN